jgi:hypothetical protein
MRKVACKESRSSLGNTEITLRATFAGVQTLAARVIASAAKQFPTGWVSRESSFPRTGESKVGPASVPVVHSPSRGTPALPPESESGVTNDRQTRVQRGAVPLAFS